MIDYHAYGLTISSEFELPELQSAERTEGPVDAVIRHGDLQPIPSTGEQTQPRRVEATPGLCRLTYEGIGTFRIEEGRRILVDVSPEMETTKVFRRILEGQVIGVLLHQRELLVVHGSAVAVDGVVTVFLGPVGAGKSTTAAACHARGHWVLDDDVVAIDLADGTPTVRPGIPELKLHPEVAATLDLDAPVAGRDDGESGKQYHQTAADWKRTPLPLDSCYRLSEGETFAIEPLPPHDRLLELVSNTYNLGLLEATDMTPTHFEQCSRVAETTPVAELRRPADMGALPAFIDEITDRESVEADELA